MPVLISHIEVEPRLAEVSVCNNAAWAAGEIALQAGGDMEQYVTPLMERLVPVLLSAKAARSLTENSAVTIGRLALVCPSAVAPHLQVFVSAWYVLLLLLCLESLPTYYFILYSQVSSSGRYQRQRREGFCFPRYLFSDSSEPERNLDRIRLLP